MFTQLLLVTFRERTMCNGKAIDDSAINLKVTKNTAELSNDSAS